MGRERLVTRIEIIFSECSAAVSEQAAYSDAQGGEHRT
jgi:hypothetical protein